MARTSHWWFSTIAAAVLLCAGCSTSGGGAAASAASPGAASPTLPMASGNTRPATVSATLLVSGAVKRPSSFDLAALKALPATTQTVGGSVYVGVSLWTLLDRATGIQPDPAIKNAALSMYVLATGADGYRALLSLAEIDPGFGNWPALVAYSMDGAPLGRNGMARLIVPGDAKMGRAVSGLARIEVLAAPVPR